jgi:hypothetical protein
MDALSPDLIRAVGSLITALAGLLTSAAVLLRTVRRRR